MEVLSTNAMDRRLRQTRGQLLEIVYVAVILPLRRIFTISSASTQTGCTGEMRVSGQRRIVLAVESVAGKGIARAPPPCGLALLLPYPIAGRGES